MSRSRPQYMPVRHFDNINSDQKSPEAIRDEIIAVLSSAADDTDAAVRYAAWCRKVMSENRIGPSALGDFQRDERVGNLRYRDNFAAAVADVLRMDPALGGADETDIEELIKWMFGEPTSIEPRTASYLFELILSPCMARCGQS
jgi:hypothetical protein